MRRRGVRRAIRDSCGTLAPGRPLGGGRRRAKPSRVSRRPPAEHAGGGRGRERSVVARDAPPVCVVRDAVPPDQIGVVRRRPRSVIAGLRPRELQEAGYVSGAQEVSGKLPRRLEQVVAALAAQHRAISELSGLLRDVVVRDAPRVGAWAPELPACLYPGLKDPDATRRLRQGDDDVGHAQRPRHCSCTIDLVPSPQSGSEWSRPAVASSRDRDDVEPARRPRAESMPPLRNSAARRPAIREIVRSNAASKRRRGLLRRQAIIRSCEGRPPVPRRRQRRPGCDQ